MIPPQIKMWPNDDQTCTSSIDGPSSPPTNSLPPPPLRHHCVATLKGHTSYTSALALAGEHLFTGSSSGQIHRADLTSLQHHQTLPDDAMIAAGEGAVKSLVASSGKLFTAHQDHKIRVWRVDHAATNHHQRITQLATLPTLSDRAVKLLLPGNHVRIRRHKTSTWVHHVDAVSALALSKDESLLYSVSWDRTLKIWRTADFKCLESVADAHDDAINAVALSGNGAVYTGSSDGKIKVWRRRQGEKAYSLDVTLTKHKAGINTLAMSADGKVLYSGASDRLVCVWRSDGGGGGMAAVAALRGHAKAVLCLAAVADMVCSGSADQTVRVWRGIGKSSYACLAILEGHRGPIKCIAVAFDHNYSSPPSSSFLLYSAGLDCDIKIWRLCLSL